MSKSHISTMHTTYMPTATPIINANVNAPVMESRWRDAIFIQQQWGTLDLCDCGIEARNRYRVYAIPRDSRHVNVDGLRQVAYIREESDCFQRQMCGPNRKLTLIVETEVSVEIWDLGF